MHSYILIELLSVKKTTIKGTHYVMTSASLSPLATPRNSSQRLATPLNLHHKLKEPPIGVTFANCLLLFILVGAFSEQSSEPVFLQLYGHENTQKYIDTGWKYR